jgi:(p)ppGpp synthase/HD superfamily hydrolase
MQLTDDFRRAFDFAFQLHRNQVRKGSETPYLAHLMAVAALIFENGGSEVEAIAGLLHDGPEDQGGKEVLEQIREKFGDRVAEIVDGCTDTYETPKPPWRERKERFLAHLPSASAQVRRVSLADKLHNASTILADFRLKGDAVWDRFNGGKEGTLWYYRALCEEYRGDSIFGMASDLDRIVSEIEKLARPDSASLHT